MKRFIGVAMATLLLAGCGGGASTRPSGAAVTPVGPASQVRSAQTIRKTFDYTLHIVPYPPGFNPPCQESNITIWALAGGHGYSPTSEIAGGTPLDIEVGPCLAAQGDHMHALLEVFYGHMRFISGNGHFSLDSVDDSHALLTITDNTTGYSTNAEAYLSY